MRLISIVKDGKRVDMPVAEFVKVVDNLAKGGPGSGRYPKGSGSKGEEHMEVTTGSGQKLTVPVPPEKSGGKEKGGESVSEIHSALKESMSRGEIPKHSPKELKEIASKIKASEEKTPEVKTPANRTGQTMRGENKYIFTHGKKPSGTGSWAFKDRHGNMKWYHQHSYGDAKKKALAEMDSPEVQT